MTDNRRSLALIATALLPLTAHAHANAGWAHGVLDGAAVFSGSIEYLLPVLAAALLPGRETPQAVRYGVYVVVAGMLAGMVAGYAVSDAIVVALLAQVYLAFLGAIVLLDLRLPARIVALFRFLTGGLVGLAYGLSPFGDPLSEPALALGLMAGAASLFLLAGFIVARFRTGWQRIAIRVAGSWIVAIAVIFIAYLATQFR